MAEKNESKALSVDELLEHQAKGGSTATVEAVAGTPGLVRVTPWSPAGGCMCHYAIDVPKGAIAGVTPTGDKHHCCGKVLAVVEVTFKDDGSVPLSTVFAQLSGRAAEGHGHGPAAGVGGREAFGATGGAAPAVAPTFDQCEDRYESCFGRARSSFQRCQCGVMLANCLGRPYRGGPCLPSRIDD